MDSSSFADSAVISVTEGQLASKLNDEVVILNLHSGVYFGLNAVGMRVWEMAQESGSFGQIRDAIVGEFDVEPEQCRRDLVDLLTTMESEGLVRIKSDRQ